MTATTTPPVSAPAPGFGGYDLILILTGVIWGSNIPLMKWVLADVHPLAFNALRFPLATLFLLVLYIRTPRPLREVDWSRSGKALLGLSLIGHVGYQAFFIHGLERTGSGNAALLVATAPLFTTLLAVWLFGERLALQNVLGLLVAFAGAAIIIGAAAGFSLGAESLRGDLLVLGSGVCWGSYTACARPVAERVHNVTLTFWTMLFAVVPLVLLGAPHLPDAVRVMTGLHWLAVMGSGVLSLGLTYWLWNVGIHGVGATRTAVYGYLAPVVSLSIGVAFLAEPLGTQRGLGALLVLVGVGLVRYRARARR